MASEKYNKILDAATEAAQKAFDELAKPGIISQMKKVKCIKIEHVMGVDFYVFANGKSLSDTDMKDASEAKVKLWEMIEEIQEAPLYSLINWNIDLTK